MYTYCTIKLATFETSFISIENIEIVSRDELKFRYKTLAFKTCRIKTLLIVLCFTRFSEKV